ncbi:hypothetical protein [Azospirillum argentinense]|uniref:minor capsid protein n=1 Tax=Azospirillum argentinense TaxID=2970906 RepID=UPI0032DF9A6F
MRIEGLVDRLATAGIGTKGRDLFSYTMPAGATGVMLRVGLDGAPVDAEIPGYHPRASFQLIVRHKDHPAGFALIERATRALVTERRTVIGAYTFNHIRAAHLPIVYPLSEGAHLEFSVNFHCNFTAA